MVTIDGQAASIAITDTVASITNSQTITAGLVTNTLTVTQQQAGVTVSLTPKIYQDGSVLLTNLSPTVTQPTGTITAGSSNVTLLSTRTMNLTGVRVRDGETLIVGGLLKEATQTDVNKVPGLDKLPILGAMFKAINSNNKDKTELVLMVTPHILKEDNVAYFHNANSGKFSNMNYGRGGIVPVALPKYTGDYHPGSTPTPAAPPAGANQDAVYRPQVESNRPPAEPKKISHTPVGSSSGPIRQTQIPRIDIMPASETQRNESAAKIILPLHTTETDSKQKNKNDKFR